MRASHFKEPHAEVWPDNWTAFELYADNRSQMIQGFGGPTGFDYRVYHAELDRLGLEGEERDNVMAGIRIIEAEVLRKHYDEQEKRRKK